MKQNYPLMVLVTGLLVLTIVISLSQPSIQQRLLLFFEMDSSAWVSKNKPQVETAKVSRVVDGDTIVLEGGRRIRYLYIDTPETVKPGESPMCFGKEASEYNQSLVEGRNVILVPDKEDMDRYGRELRIVYFVGTDITDVSRSVNAKLVEGGFADISIYNPNNTYEDEMRSIAEKAKKQKKGAWSACEQPFEK
jgi:micrococcal nuclease